jgi:hypothetical protein
MSFLLAILEERTLTLDVGAAVLRPKNKVPLDVGNVVEWNGRERLEEGATALRAHFVLETPADNDRVAGPEPAGLALDRDRGISFEEHHHLLAGLVRVCGDACAGLIGDAAQEHLVAADRL